jgi:hypothetical protein
VVFAAAAGDDDGGDDDGDDEDDDDDDDEDDDGHNGFANENVDEDGELAAEARVPRTLQASYHNGTMVPSDSECVSRVMTDVLSQTAAAPSKGQLPAVASELAKQSKLISGRSSRTETPTL